jgi:hypothetical protein
MLLTLDFVYCLKFETETGVYLPSIRAYTFSISNLASMPFYSQYGTTFFLPYSSTHEEQWQAAGDGAIPTRSQVSHPCMLYIL